MGKFTLVRYTRRVVLNEIALQSPMRLADPSSARYWCNRSNFNETAFYGGLVTIYVYR